MRRSTWRQNPEHEDADIAQHPHEPGHERRMRLQPYLDLFLEPVRRLPELDRGVHRFRQKEFHSEIEHEYEAEQFHRRLDVAALNERTQAGERDETVNHLHQRGAGPDERRPLQAAPRSLVHDGEIHRTHGDRDDESADQAGQTGKNNGMIDPEMFHRFDETEGHRHCH